MLAFLLLLLLRRLLRLQRGEREREGIRVQGFTATQPFRVLLSRVLLHTLSTVKLLFSLSLLTYVYLVSITTLSWLCLSIYLNIYLSVIIYLFLTNFYILYSSILFLYLDLYFFQVSSSIFLVQASICLFLLHVVFCCYFMLLIIFRLFVSICLTQTPDILVVHFSNILYNFHLPFSLHYFLSFCLPICSFLSLSFLSSLFFPSFESSTTICLLPKQLSFSLRSSIHFPPPWSCSSAKALLRLQLVSKTFSPHSLIQKDSFSHIHFLSITCAHFSIPILYTQRETGCKKLCYVHRAKSTHCLP